MDDLVEMALTADIAHRVPAVTVVAMAEVGRQADEIVGVGPLPGTPEWEAEAGTDLPARRQLAWQLACLRLELGAGLDGVETVIVLRGSGVTWAVIGRAAGVTRQSAHERWGARVAAVLDRYGTGMPESVADDDPVAAD
ncbi:hypothetical protein [Rhodococcus sp. NPDC059234]|uniref:hypothetical protein n=1 Tax=Rhodococcus sp. NPDC059234 TaxID=3346781 RepID=UPI00366B7D86